MGAAADDTDPAVFGTDFLRRLERLQLLARKRLGGRGRGRGRRPTRRVGTSLEFADYRPYAPGDDPRAIDWNIFARLDRLVVKLFEAERDLDIHILVDASPSMAWRGNRPGEGGGGPTKLDHARRLAAALAYIGLASLDRVNVAFFGAALGDDLGLCRGRSQFHKVLAFLARPPAAAGRTSLRAVCGELVRRVQRRGLIVVIGDLWDPEGVGPGFASLAGAGVEVEVVQTLDPAELDFALAGEFRLVDAETGEAVAAACTPAANAAYAAAVAEFLADVAACCAARGFGYARVTTDIPFDEVALRVLRERGVVR